MRGIPMKIKGVIFDLDGTLIDSMWVWDKVDKDFLGVRGFEVPPDYQKEIQALGFYETACYTIDRFGLKERPEDIIKEWNDMAERTYHKEVQIKPYARELLVCLREQGIHLGVATASYASLFTECLKRNRVYDFFECFTETSEVERGKGFPDIYIKAAGKLACSPQECLVFEDIHQGILGAKAGGFCTVGVFDKKSADSWAEIQHDSDYAIRGFGQLLQDAQLFREIFGEECRQGICKS